MQKGLRKLYTGDFNAMSQEDHRDGTRTITLYKEGEDKIYRFKVRDLYGEYEVVLQHKVIPHKIPPWVLDRMKEAKKADGKRVQT